MAYFVSNKLEKFIKRGKNKIDNMSQCDVIYKITCRDCSYVRQTKRQLGTRIKEHVSLIKGVICLLIIDLN